MNRISHPDWVKLCVDPNGRIKLRTKQKCEILSATNLIKKQDEDLITFASIVNDQCVGFKLAELNPDNFKCDIYLRFSVDKRR